MMSVRRALIVATGMYRDAKLRELRAPAADAERLAGVLRNPAIGAFDVDIALDADESPLRRRIARFFAGSARDDVLLLHISGHGVKDAHGGLYLAASDTELDLLDATALSAMWLEQQISRSRSRRKLLLLDCCFSGRFPFNATARTGDSVDVQERFQGRGRAVITASTAMEYAYEGDELSGEGQPSYFTAALVEALETGEADRDRDQWISVDELYEYVYDRVKDVSPNQTPTKQIALEGPLYVARSIFKRPTEPAKLDEQLLLLTEHPLAAARVGAVDELQRLLASTNAGVARAARQALEAMVDDDSRRVSELAARALANQAELEHELRERERAAREAAAKEQAEREQAELDAKQQAERERAAREAAAKEQAEREQAELDAKQQAERERAAQEAAATERAEREQAELDAKQQADRERAAQEAAARGPGRGEQQLEPHDRPSQRQVAGEAATLREDQRRPPSVQSPPKLKGRARAGGTLRVVGTSLAEPGPIMIRHQWQHRTQDGLVLDIAGATDTTLRVSDAYVGGAVRARITATSPSGSVTIDTPWTRTVTFGGRGRQYLLASATIAAIAAIVVVLLPSGSTRHNSGSTGPSNGSDSGGIAVQSPTGIPVGRSPSGIAVGHGSVWVANRDDNAVTRIDASSGRVVGAPISVGHSPKAIAIGQGSVWVANSQDNTVTRINGTSATVAGPPINVGHHPTAIAVGQGSVWVVNNRDHSVTQINAGSGRVLRPAINVDTSPNAVAVGEGRVWVASEFDTVTRLDARSATVDGLPIIAGDSPAGIAVGYGKVWVANYTSDSVTRIDASSGNVLGKPIRVGGFPTAIAVGHGSVWVTNESDNTVTRIDATSGKAVGDPINVGTNPGAIVVGNGSVWVASPDENVVTQIDASSGKVLCRSRLCNAAAQLHQ